MKEIRCIKCGRPLRDPLSIARGMGPECAGTNGARHKKYHSRVQSRSGSSYANVGHGSTDSLTLFSLARENEQQVEQSLVEGIFAHKSDPPEILRQYPADLIDLVLSAPASGAIAWHVKNHSRNRQKLGGSRPPGKVLQEIRRMCIDLRLTFWPGMSNHQGQQIACVPHGDEDWKFENSEKVMSRQELESYLARYGMISAARR